MKTLYVRKEGLVDDASGKTEVSWDTLKEVFPDYLQKSNDAKKFIAAARTYLQKEDNDGYNKFYKMVFPYMCNECPSCGLKFQAELEVRMLERDFNYCIFCREHIDDIFEKWRNAVTIKVEE